MAEVYPARGFRGIGVWITLFWKEGGNRLAPANPTPLGWRRDAAIVVLAALVMRVYGLTGDMLYDPIVYAQNAVNLLQGTFTLETSSWFAHRMTVFVPVVPIYGAFGVGTLQSKLWPLLLSLAQVGLLLAFGRRFLPWRATLVGGWIVALAPLDVVYSTVLNPDIVIAAFMTATMVFWFWAFEERVTGPAAARPAEPDRLASRSPAPRTLLFLAGTCLALAVVTRLFAVILVLPLVAHLLLRRPSWRELLWVAAGGLTVALPLGVAYALQTGDPLYRFGVVTGRYGEGAKSEGTQFGFYFQLIPHVRYTLTGLAPAMFLLGVLGALWKPTRGQRLLLLWALPVAAYLQFGSMSASEYIPILKRERFLLPLSVPFALLAGVAITRLTGWIERRLPLKGGLIVLGLAVLAINSVEIVSRNRAEGWARHAAFSSTVAALQREPQLPVLFDHWRTGYRFSYYFGFEEGADFYRGGDDAQRMGRPGAFGESRLGYLAWYPTVEDVPRALVVLDETVLAAVRRGDSVTQTYRPGEVPDYAFDPPAHWHEVSHHGTFRVWRTF